MNEEPKKKPSRAASRVSGGGSGRRIYGMSAHDMSRAALRTRATMEHLFILITMGDMLGIPILPPYYSLRLLPYVVPADRDLEAPHAAGEGCVRRHVLGAALPFGGAPEDQE